MIFSSSLRASAWCWLHSASVRGMQPFQRQASAALAALGVHTVDFDLAERMIGFPGNALRVGNPIFIRTCIAAF